MDLEDLHRRVVNFLASPAASPAPVCRTQPAVVLDISAGAAPVVLPEPPGVGIGRYLEDRDVYTSDAYATEDPAERRTIHLGIDVFLPAGEPVLAPFDGAVAAIADRDRPKDFGPVMLLAHRASDGTPFLTLYGHLARASIANWQRGDRVTAGAELARLGDRHENGDWPPHLHFQIIVDDLGWGAGIWGVAPRSQLDLWRLISPDPNLILRIPGVVPASA